MVSSDTPIEHIRVWEGDELVFDGADPTTYVVVETNEDLDEAFAALTDVRWLHRTEPAPPRTHARRRRTRPRHPLTAPLPIG